MSTVDSVPMTLFAETYDRVLKMIAKRDLGNYPAHSRAGSHAGGPGENARHLESGLGRDQSPAADSRLADRHARPGRVSRRSAELAHRRRTGAPGRRLQFLHAAASRARNAATGWPAIPSSGRSSWQRRPKLKTILQFGESGDPASPHWFDQAALYAKKQFKPSWYAQADVEAHSERHYHPGE